MTLFGTREKAFEDKFVYDANMRFLASARRDKRLGAWAAESLGLTGPAAADYARVIRVVGADSAFKKIKSDFAAWSIPISDDELKAKIAQFDAQAAQEVASGL